MTPDSLLSLLAIGSVAIVGWLIVGALRRGPAAAVYVIGGLWVAAEVVELPAWNALGLQLRTLDLVAVLALMVGTGRLLRERRRRIRIIAWAMLGLYAVALVRGLLRGGESALGFGDHLVALAGIIYGASWPIDARRRRALYMALQRLVGLLVAVLVFLQVGVIGRADGSRALSAASVMLIALAAFAVVERRQALGAAIRPYELAWLGVLAASLVISQHRTVWIAVAFGIVLLSLSSPRAMFGALAGLVLVGALVVILDVAGVQGSRDHFEGDSLIGSLEAASEDSRNWDWRRQRWDAALETNAARGTPAVLVGAGYGTSWVDVGPHASRTEPPHSQYVELAVRYGVVGLAGWVWLYVSSVRGLRRQRGARSASVHLSNRWFTVLLATQLAWSVTYSLGGVHPVWLGLAISAGSAASGPRCEPPGLPRPLATSHGSDSHHRRSVPAAR